MRCHGTALYESIIGMGSLMGPFISPRPYRLDLPMGRYDIRRKASHGQNNPPRRSAEADYVPMMSVYGSRSDGRSPSAFPRPFKNPMR